MTNLIPLYDVSVVKEKTTHAMARLIFIPLDKINSHRLNSKLSVTEGRATHNVDLISYHAVSSAELSKPERIGLWTLFHSPVRLKCL